MLTDCTNRWYDRKPHSGQARIAKLPRSFRKRQSGNGLPLPDAALPETVPSSRKKSSRNIFLASLYVELSLHRIADAAARHVIHAAVGLAASRVNLLYASGFSTCDLQIIYGDCILVSTVEMAQSNAYRTSVSTQVKSKITPVQLIIVSLNLFLGDSTKLSTFSEPPITYTANLSFKLHQARFPDFISNFAARKKTLPRT